MEETLIIKKFGPIKDVTLDLSKINVLIGDQGTGKSTVAKLIYSIHSFFSYKISHVGSFNNSENEFSKQFYLHLTSTEIFFNINDDTIIEYRRKDSQGNYFGFSFKENKLMVENYAPQSHHRSEKNYIVAERTFISILSDSLYGLNELGTKLPTLFNRFGNKFQNVRKEKDEWDYLKILNVKFKHIIGVDYVELHNENLVPFSMSSTGMQGTIPLLVVFDSIVNNIQKTNLSRSKSKYSVEHLLIVEEPELNLFPETQKKLIEYIVGKNYEIPIELKVSETNSEDVNPIEDYENKVYKNQLIFTTHSPYILTSLNNLMYAYKVGQEHKDEVSAIIPEKYWVNPTDVRCYLMEDGAAKLIMDEETKLIDTIKIDGVSDVLSAEFNKIMEIEISNEFS